MIIRTLISVIVLALDMDDELMAFGVLRDGHPVDLGDVNFPVDL